MKDFQVRKVNYLDGKMHILLWIKKSRYRNLAMTSWSLRGGGGGGGRGVLGFPVSWMIKKLKKKDQNHFYFSLDYSSEETVQILRKRRTKIILIFLWIRIAFLGCLFLSSVFSLGVIIMRI